MLWFTADEHYGHANIIKYCNRPFRDVMEMDARIIRNHNSLVKLNDIVYHLGDFMFGAPARAEVLLANLNGTHILIRGNHDKPNIERYFKEVHDVLFVYTSKPAGLWLSHYPHRIWPQRSFGCVHLYGHIHSKNYFNEVGALDAGVDAHDFKPINLDYIVKYVKPYYKKGIKEEL